MSQNHKLLHDLKEICKCHGINQGKAVLMFELYMELCEVYKLWDVEHHFHKKLKIFYLTGKLKKKDESCNVYVPVTTDEIFSMKHIEDLQVSLSPEHKMLILVFKDQDSSSTFYKVTQGLIKPDSPATAQANKIEEKKNFKFKRCVKKSQKKLYTIALENEKKRSTI